VKVRVAVVGLTVEGEFQRFPAFIPSHTDFDFAKGKVQCEQPHNNDFAPINKF